MIKLPPLKPTDGFFTWRANITQDGHCRLLVFMHEASRYVLTIKRPLAKDFKHLPELFRKTLIGTLLLEQINPAVIERYLAEAGEITFTANSGKEGTAWLNTACRNAWIGFHNTCDNESLGAFASHIWIGTHNTEAHCKPVETFIKMLSRYEMPVKSSTAYDLNVRLELADTCAVRQIRVPANITFTQLHKILQIAFCWHDYHLFRFCFYKGKFDYYTEPDVVLACAEDYYDPDPDTILTHNIRLSDYLPKWQRCMYNYDFGDNWRHIIELTKVHENYEGEMPLLLSGSGDAPPEDVGGPFGFEEFKQTIANPKDDEYESMIAWAEGQWWKPFNFDDTARNIKFALW